jgi:hypothetical protein
VQWVEAPHPWDIEPEVIALMRPPLNRDHNDTHPEYTLVGLARDSVRDEAKTRRMPFKGAVRHRLTACVMSAATYLVVFSTRISASSVR